MSEYGDFHVEYMPVLVQANLQEESVTRKVTVRLKSRCDENDQCGHVGTCQVLTLLGTTKDTCWANRYRKNLNLLSQP